MEFLRTLTREFEVGARALLDIENRAGTIHVRGDATSGARVEVVARLWAETEREADDQFELIDRGVRQEGEKLIVRAPPLVLPSGFLGLLARRPRIDYQLTVPEGSRGRIVNRSGPVEATNLAGPLEIEARSGRTSVSRIGADTKIVQRSGGAQAESIAGDLTIESRSGGVKVRSCKGNLSVDSRSGAISVEQVGGDVRVLSRSGSVSVADVGGGLSVQTRSGSVRYAGGVHGPFDIDVRSGSVQLALDGDSSFFLDAETVSGAAHSDFVLRKDSASPPGKGPKVRVRTRTGSIYVTRR